MSFGLPPLKGLDEGVRKPIWKQGPYGTDAEIHTLGPVKGRIQLSHPLEKLEENFAERRDRMNLALLRNTQGCQAPMKLVYEMKAVQKVGRLPCLISSKIAEATLRDEDDRIDFTDILNPEEFREEMVPAHYNIKPNCRLPL